MNAPTALNKVLDLIATTAAQTPDDAHAMPPQVYASPELWELEKERILRQEWYCVGRDTDFSVSGDYLSLTLLDEPVVVWRGADDQLRAMSNICRHRNALITEQGTGNKRVLVCPYHKWTYEDNGQLRGAPDVPEHFDKSAICLPQYPLEIWQGFVFVSLSAEPAPLAPRLGSLEELVGDTRMDQFAWSFRVPEKSLRANWKIMVENGMDGYHVAYVHPKTLGTNIQRIDSPWGDGQWNTSCERRNEPWPEHADDPQGLSELNRINTYTIGVFPLLLFSLDCHCLIWYSIFPVSADECVVRAGVAARSPDKLCSVGSPEPVDPQEYMQWVTELLGEDAPIVEGIQRAVQTDKAGCGPLIKGQEDNLQFFYRYLARHLCSQ
ncbi:MAG: aromatic ring-hydroxylating dioxygenase subunit alpha [Gammaproteobacteria bacterium]|nr:aromatic ring-hydroxylating dioxygenase subunit alpha [Gammaproteobacteria bacterium]